MNSDSLTVLVTGATKGLGFYLAEYFLKAGHFVFALVKIKSNAISALKKKYHSSFRIFKADVTQENTIRKMAEKIKKISFAVDILINNAGIHLEQDQPDIGALDFSGYVNTYRTNTIGPLMVINHCIPFVRAGRKKLIVNISSEAGSIQNAGRKSEYSYCMSKAALNMASKLLQNRLRNEGIKVLAIHPGWFSSDMGGSNAALTPEEAAAKVGKIILKNREIDDPVYIDSDDKEIAW